MNAKCAGLQCEQKRLSSVNCQLKAELDETKLALSKVQNEKKEMKLSYESMIVDLERKYKQQLTEIYTTNQVEKAIQAQSGTDTVSVELVGSMFQLYKEKSVKLDEANNVLQTVIADMKNSAIMSVDDGGDGPITVNITEPPIQTPATSSVSESEAKRSVTVGGLGANVKHDDLMKHYSKFGTVLKVITAGTNFGTRKALVVFAESSSTIMTAPIVNGVKLSINTIPVSSFVNRKLRNMKVVHYSSDTKTKPLQASYDEPPAEPTVDAKSKPPKESFATPVVKTTSNCPISVNETERSIIVTGTEAEMQNDELISYYSRYGSVTKIMIDSLCKKKALITFNDSTVTKNIVTTGHVIDGHAYQVNAKHSGGEFTGFFGKTSDFQIIENLSTQSTRTTTWKQTDENLCPLSDGEKQRSIFVGGLVAGIEHEDLTRYFSKFGTVAKIVVATKTQRKLLVMFSDSTVRDSAFTGCYTMQANFDNFGKGKIETVYDNTSSECTTQLQPNVAKPVDDDNWSAYQLTREEQKRTILLSGGKNENENSTPRDLVHHFAKYGKVINVGTPINDSTQTFVTFETIEASEECVKIHDYLPWLSSIWHTGKTVAVRSFITQLHVLDSKAACVKVTSAMEPSSMYLLSESEQQRSIIVVGLSGKMPDDEIVHYFSQFGTVTKVVVETANNTKKALVTFAGYPQDDISEISATITDESDYWVISNPQFFGKNVFEVIYDCPNCTALSQSIATDKSVDEKPPFDQHDLDSKECTTNTEVLKTAEDTFSCEPCQSKHSVQSRVVFSPCGHGSCADCAAQLEKCHICTNVIESKMKQFE